MQTMSDETEARSAEHVLGVVGARQRAAFARAIDADPALGHDVLTWNARLAPLSGSEEVEPPAGLFDRVAERIASRSRYLPDTFTVRADEGMWFPIAEGVERKTLWSKGPNGRETYLVRMAPGAHFVAHHHDDDEECYMVAGDLTFDTLTLHAGDYHLARRGMPHPVAVTSGGCVLLVTAAA
jgi:hypothetical protein